jgi:hypothetical protein
MMERHPQPAAYYPSQIVIVPGRSAQQLDYYDPPPPPISDRFPQTPTSFDSTGSSEENVVQSTAMPPAIPYGDVDNLARHLRREFAFSPNDYVPTANRRPVGQGQANEFLASTPKVTTTLNVDGDFKRLNIQGSESS